MTDSQAVRLCLLLAGKLQLGAVTPQVVGRFSNIAVALEPLPIVARIPAGTALLRHTENFARREVAIAHFLAARGAPIVPPCEAPLAGPHQVEGCTISLWRRVAILPEPSDPAVAGERLAACHALLADYSSDLPDFGALDELDVLLAHPLVTAVISPRDRAFLIERAGQCRRALRQFSNRHQALHGDAHRKNLLNTVGGPLWGDWEDAMRAPVEWDLACLVTGARITKDDNGWSEAALAAYGPYDPSALDWCIRLRAASGAAWLALLSHQDSTRLGRLAVWLERLGSA